jgi:ammonia channel protein AmtB
MRMEEYTMNAGDTAFILLCAAFVFIMTPGLAFFYGGMVRRKNVGNTMMQRGDARCGVGTLDVAFSSSSGHFGKDVVKWRHNEET